jgi:hypothetical protein
MYYVLTCEYVGPNTRDSAGNRQSCNPVATIETQPGRTNQSGQERIEGWLGTTNDWSRTAHGEFETLEAARAQCASLGCTVLVENEDSLDGTVETYRDPADLADHWEAEEWFQNADPDGLAAETTDEELEQIMFREDAFAAGPDSGSSNPHGVILHDLDKWLIARRAELRGEE